ncbi:AlpA family phage regulatory protein [Rhodoferax sp. 4810]|nr:AlpA family phage regulatory protein [Rhodoferax jenense]
MSNHLPPCQVLQSAKLCTGHTDRIKSGTFNRTERSTMVSAVRFPAKQKLPDRKVQFVPDAQLDSSVAILDYIKAHGAETVLVSAEYAKHFKPAPQDGRTYVVADPRRPGVLHFTYPDGRYKCDDGKSPPTVGGIPIVIHPKRVFYSDRKNGKRTRLAHKVCAKATVVRQDSTPPEICLIDIHRVTRITGFKKSFIYAQPDFPEPVRLGASRRSSVRWIEAEILGWVRDLVSKRNGNQASI